MAAGAQRSNLALDDVGMPGEAQIVVAADLDVTRPRRAPLQRVAPPPQLYFAANVIVVSRSRMNSGSSGAVNSLFSSPNRLSATRNCTWRPPLCLTRLSINPKRRVNSKPISLREYVRQRTNHRSSVCIYIYQNGPNWLHDGTLVKSLLGDGGRAVARQCIASIRARGFGVLLKRCRSSREQWPDLHRDAKIRRRLWQTYGATAIEALYRIIGDLRLSA